MKRNIKRVAVIGSGVMGSRIACHFANVGLDVLLLDIVPKEATDSTDKVARNKIVNEALKTALKSNPSPIYSKKYGTRITTGNLEDDLHLISKADWVIEVVIERLDIKKQVFENIEKYRKPGTLITSNTSGIPINMMLEGRSEDFQAHFLGTHFFNPPRYLKLFEIIPTPKTNPDLVDFLMEYGSKILGKTTVLAKDTPAFIANRIGVFSIQALFHLVSEMELTVGEVDKLTGPIMGRPKSATFRTCDVVGLDTLVHVANGVKDNCPNDERKELFEIPSYVSNMVENGWLGSKSKQGFFKKIKNAEGKSEILELNLKTMEYQPKTKAKFPTLEMVKSVENLKDRTKMLYNGMDKAGEFYKKSFHGVFQYVSNRIPEISDELYRIDDGVKAGFGWELGPFESWDAIGVKAVIKNLEKVELKPAQWVYEMIESGHETFYKVEGGTKYYYDIPTKSYLVIPGTENLISLENLRESNTVWKNAGVHLIDLGDGVLNVEFHTKMNTIGSEILQGLNKAIDLAESDPKWKGIVIANEGQNFSAGANVGMIFMMAIEQDWDELNFSVKAFQNTMMRLRYSSIPVVAAPHGMALGGGCEICLHSDKVIANAETYMGLVEFGVGLIPGGGGTKEFVVRLNDELKEGDIRTNQLRNRFLTIGQAKVSTSGQEAFELGYLRDGQDEVIVSRAHQISYAKQQVLLLDAKGYVEKPQRTDIEVMGNEGIGIVYVGAHSMKAGNYISDHDQFISEKLGTVMCGGELSKRTKVSEQYLLDLERKAFLELCQQPKTLKRIESILKTGKVLRN